MLTDKITKLFLKESSPEGLSSVGLVKISRQLGYPITRNTLRELAEFDIIPKPSLVNDSSTTGKRVAYTYEALVKLLVYEILTDAYPGLNKGSAIKNKNVIIAEAIRLAEEANFNMQSLIAIVNIQSLLSACRIVGGKPSKYGFSSTSELRQLLIKITLTYALLYNWLNTNDNSDVCKDWKLLKHNVVNAKNDILAKAINQGVHKVANLNTTHQKEQVDSLEAYENCFKNIKNLLKRSDKADLLEWIELVTLFENGSGLISSEANEALTAKYGTTCFSSDGHINWLLALTFNSYITK